MSFGNEFEEKADRLRKELAGDGPKAPLDEDSPILQKVNRRTGRDHPHYHVAYIAREADILRVESFHTLKELSAFIIKLPDDEVELAIFQGRRIPFAGRESIARIIIDGKEFIPEIE